MGWVQQERQQRAGKGRKGQEGQEGQEGEGGKVKKARKGRKDRMGGKARKARKGRNNLHVVFQYFPVVFCSNELKQPTEASEKGSCSMVRQRWRYVIFFIKMKFEQVRCFEFEDI